MLDRTGWARVAACAALACAGLVRAEASPAQDQAPRPLYLQETPPAAAPATAPAAPTKPLMALLDQIGVGKSLEDSGINIYGFVEGGYTYSASAPPGNIITGNVFNTKHERI